MTNKAYNTSRAHPWCTTEAAFLLFHAAPHLLGGIIYVQGKTLINVHTDILSRFTGTEVHILFQKKNKKRKEKQEKAEPKKGKS